MYLFKYILKRLGLAVLTFFIIISMCFILVKLLPNKQDVGFGKSAELIKKRREMLGYDKPLPVQFWRFWRFAIVGEFGASEVIFQGRLVWDVFVEKVPFTVALNIYSSVLSIPIGLVLGIIAAVNKNKWPDHLISTGVMIFVSVPSFIYGFIVQYLLCFRLGWFSPVFVATEGAFSWVAFQSYVPAILCLSFGSIAGYARTLRAELSEILTSDYLLLARTKGLTRNQATVRHAFRNAMVPIFPAILGEFIAVMSGSLIIEQMFSIPGVGKLYVNSIQASPPDYNFFMLLSAFYTAIGLLAGIVIDISYSIIDPRIRVGAR
ncbi:MAG: ABC transporter permease [Clostridia bacterium]|nr:ABC transporter permease [Clostridia bacterium]